MRVPCRVLQSPPSAYSIGRSSEQHLYHFHLQRANVESSAGRRTQSDERRTRAPAVCRELRGISIFLHRVRKRNRCRSLEIRNQGAVISTCGTMSPNEGAVCCSYGTTMRVPCFEDTEQGSFLEETGPFSELFPIIHPIYVKNPEYTLSLSLSAIEAPANSFVFGKRRQRREMETGKVVVERIRGKSTVTRCFSKYPLKFIIPTKVGSSLIDAVWIYSLTYGGGIVSGDSISCDLTIGDGCTTVLTTQASTKVYKSVQSKCSEQVLEARVGSNALLAVIPDPVTCFSTAKYSQKQVFRVASDSNLLIVDWITSGRHESGERWDFELYKSTNHIFLEGNQPLFLDSILLEQGSITSIAERMQSYQVLAMVILLGPKLQHVQSQIQQEVKEMVSKQLHLPSTSFGCHGKTNADNRLNKPAFIASCSVFGPKGVGGVVRIAATTTESVYRFLQHQLVGLEPLLGVSPYHKP